MHSEGPWTCDPNIGVIFGANGKAIQTGGAGCNEESRGNAFLIGAAPELLRAAQMLLALVEGSQAAEFLDRENVEKAAKDAIRKAFEPGARFICSKCGYSGLVHYPHPKRNSEEFCHYEAGLITT